MARNKLRNLEKGWLIALRNRGFRVILIERLTSRRCLRARIGNSVHGLRVRRSCCGRGIRLVHVMLSGELRMLRNGSVARCRRGDKAHARHMLRVLMRNVLQLVGMQRALNSAAWGKSAASRAPTGG
jgi:hypothetical protein